jgi:hypothetical protein
VAATERDKKYTFRCGSIARRVTRRGPCYLFLSNGYGWVVLEGGYGSRERRPQTANDEKNAQLTLSKNVWVVLEEGERRVLFGGQVADLCVNQLTGSTEGRYGYFR